MSVLTKIFVVLHVIVSLMLAAGLIVFVNRQENYKEAANAAKDRANTAERATVLKDQEVAKVTALKQVSEQELITQINDVNTKLAEALKSVDKSQTDLATKDAQIASLNAERQSMVNQLGAKDAQLAAQIAADVKLQGERDDIVKKYSDDERKITALTNERDVVRKHDKYMAELYADLQKQLDDANNLIRKYGVPAGGNGNAVNTEKPVINATPNVNINGVVRDFRTINGVPWATISLGSADAVTRGMQFNVVDQGKFLGYPTFDAVNIHDATGYMKGPAVSQVRPNISEVHSQLN